MMTRAPSSAVALGQQPVQAGDADVVEAVDVVAHDLGRDRRFLGHRQVRSPGRADEDHALAALDGHAPLDDPRLLVEDGVGHQCRHGLERRRRPCG